MKKFIKNLLNFPKNFLFIRNLNTQFTGSYFVNFVYWPENYNKQTFIKLIFSNGKSLIIYTEREKTEDCDFTNKITIKSIIEAWSKSKINGFGLIDFSFRDTISLLEKKTRKENFKNQNHKKTRDNFMTAIKKTGDQPVFRFLLFKHFLFPKFFVIFNCKPMRFIANALYNMECRTSQGKL